MLPAALPRFPTPRAEIAGSTGKPLQIEKLGRASWMPVPLALTLEQENATQQPDGCEPNESRLVQVANVRILSAGGELLAAGAKFGDDTNRSM